MFFMSNWPAPQKDSKISISAFSISISISQLIFIDISISAISMTALIETRVPSCSAQKPNAAFPHARPMMLQIKFDNNQPVGLER